MKPKTISDKLVRIKVHSVEKHYKERYQEIGEFIVKFSQLEGAIGELLEFILKLNNFQGLHCATNGRFLHKLFQF